MSDIILSVDGDLRPLESKLNRISSRNISLNLKDSNNYIEFFFPISSFFAFFISQNSNTIYL